MIKVGPFWVATLERVHLFKGDRDPQFLEARFWITSYSQSIWAPESRY
jgi:hypothetical protein